MEKQEKFREKFEEEPKIYSFKDGRFSFWEGNINENAVMVIRVREDNKPSKRWVEKGLPPGIPLRPAPEEHIQRWLDSHPDYKINA